MPKADHYAGMTTAEALRALADHHGQPRTRHITADEVAILYRAADRLEQITALDGPARPAQDELAMVLPLERRANNR